MECQVCHQEVNKLYPVRFGTDSENPEGFILYVGIECVPEDQIEVIEELDYDSDNPDHERI